MILRARLLLPVTAPPIEDGAVVISGNQIQAAGSWRDLRPHVRARAMDLGEVILLPGLVNAHCHLDYTDLAGQLPPPKSFTDWISAIAARKADWNQADYARSWRRGAAQLLQTGVTTVADIEAVPDLLPEAWNETPLRVCSFLEMTGVLSRRDPRAILREALDKIDSLRHPRSRAMLSPHAPYSTVPELLRLTGHVSRRRKWRVSIHAAESVQEFEMFAHARGALHNWLQRCGRDNADCGHGSPVAHLAHQRLLGENILAIHVNCLARGDAALLGKSKTHVVHCPLSHAYFQHPQFERERLVRAGVNVCLGTDSLATVRPHGKHKPALNMFAEMRALADHDRAITPREILRMSTVNGARALDLAGQVGEISQRALADLIALPFTGRAAQIYEAILAHIGPVHASLVGGRWALPPA